MEQTKELQINIMNFKAIPGVVDVQVSETPDYIEEQIKADCVKFSIFGASSFVELYVPKKFCLYETVEFNEQLVHQIVTFISPDYPRFQKLLSTESFYVDPVTEYLVPLDGAVDLEELSEVQIKLVEKLKTVNRVKDVKLKRVVDPELLKRVDDDNAILVVCYTENFDDNTLGFILPERSYTDESVFDSIAEELKQLFLSAIVG